MNSLPNSKKPSPGREEKLEFRRKRTVRSRIIYSVSGVFFFGLILYLLIFLKPLILPVVLGLLAAYLCQPLLSSLYRKGVPRWASVILLLGGFMIFLFFSVRYAVTLIPGENEQLQYRVSIQDNINDRYQYYMGIDDDEEGNMVYNLIGPELDPLMDSINRWLHLSDQELESLEDWAAGEPSIDRQVLNRYIENHNNRVLYTEPELLVSERPLEADQDADASQVDDEGESLILSTLNVLSIWLVMPVMFLFFLIDNGQIRKGFISMVPNNYFEMSLTVLNNVDRAIGNYLRGTVIETVLMSATIWLLLVLIGFDARIAVILAIISGIANVIPIFGMFIGIAVCIVYALIMEEVNSILPFITLNNLVLWTVIVHAIAQAIDNAVYKPFVLGRAVSLHPIVVFLGAIAGSMLFGFIGLLFAIPAIVIIKEILSTFFREMKAYFLIY